VLLATIVGGLATVFRGNVMALGGRFVFFCSGGVRINHMVVLVHFVSSSHLSSPRVPGLDRKGHTPGRSTTDAAVVTKAVTASTAWWLLTSNGHTAKEGQLGLDEWGWI
jgi:hypothetical protein